MLRFLAALVAATMLASGCTGPDPATTASGESAHHPRCDPELDDGLHAWADAGFSGTVAISTNGRFDCLAGYGRADRSAGTTNSIDTVFGIGSISKAFTATAVLRLIDEDALALNDRAGSILPRLRGSAARATVRQLLLHTSGLTGSIGNDHMALGHDAAVRNASRLERAYRPGSRYLYSNAGYTLLALIVEQVAKRGYRGYLASRVLRLPDGDVAGGFWDGEPAAAGPRAVGYLDDGPSDQRGHFSGPHWALSGNGDLAMTTRELARWTRALFRGELVSAKSTAIVAGPGLPQGRGRSVTPGWVVFDESVYGEPVLATSGGGGDIGQDAVVAWLPDSDRVVAIASNTQDVRAEDLLAAIAPALVAGDAVPPPDTTREAMGAAELARLAGRYRVGENASLEVTAGEDGIAVTARGEDAVHALFPLPENIGADTAEAHRQQVVALLDGDTDAGAEERELIESDFGTITDVAASGTLVADDELRTYVTVQTGQGPTLGWYALDRAGGIVAAEIPTGPPELGLVPIGGERFGPDDPTGDGPDLTVTFDGDRMTLTGADGTTVARRQA